MVTQLTATTEIKFGNKRIHPSMVLEKSLRSIIVQMIIARAVLYIRNMAMNRWVTIHHRAELHDLPLWAIKAFVAKPHSAAPIDRLTVLLQTALYSET